MAFQPDIYGESDVGLIREENEDQFLIARISTRVAVEYSSLREFKDQQLQGHPLAHLMVVADGMGGHHDGQQASHIVTRTLLKGVLSAVQWFFHGENQSRKEIMDQLGLLFHDGQQQLEQESGGVGAGQAPAMGTTLTLACVVWPHLYLAHVGDSRCYLVRDQNIRQLTRDHTIAQRLADEGAMNPDLIRVSQLRNVLWNVVGGGQPDLVPDCRLALLAEGDGLVLCSDGLNEHVTDQEICSHVAHSTSSVTTCRQLIELARERGGADNITAIVARFINGGEDTATHNADKSDTRTHDRIPIADSEYFEPPDTQHQ